MRSYAPSSGKNFASRSGRDFNKETEHAEIITKIINESKNRIVLNDIRYKAKMELNKVRKLLLVLKNHRKIESYCGSSVSGYNKYKKKEGVMVTIEDVKEASTY